jgi:hypothetical protein
MGAETFPLLSTSISTGALGVDGTVGECAPYLRRHDRGSLIVTHVKQRRGNAIEKNAHAGQLGRNPVVAVELEGSQTCRTEAGAVQRDSFSGRK